MDDLFIRKWWPMSWVSEFCQVLSHISDCAALSPPVPLIDRPLQRNTHQKWSNRVIGRMEKNVNIMRNSWVLSLQRYFPANKWEFCEKNLLFTGFLFIESSPEKRVLFGPIALNSILTLIHATFHFLSLSSPIHLELSSLASFSFFT